MPAPIAWTVCAGVKYVSPAFTGTQFRNSSTSPVRVSSHSRSRVMGSRKPSAIVAPGAASRMCHISVLPRSPSSPSSGCTCTLRRSLVKISLTSSGRSGGPTNQASPMGRADSAYHGAKLVRPQTRSTSRTDRRIGSGIFDDELVHAIEAALELVHRGGVADADVTIGAEGLARHHRNVRFGEQALGELNGVADAVFADDGADIRVGVERATRLRALDAGNCAQTLHHEIPPLVILGE